MIIKYFDLLPTSALNIRLKVFGDEQGFADEVDDIDSFSTHFIAFEEDVAVATCRVFLKEGKYILGRCAVLKEYRKKGIGRQLLLAAEDYVKSKGYSSLSLHSQLRAVPFYEKCGYVSYGEVELEENYPHLWMKKTF